MEGPGGLAFVEEEEIAYVWGAEPAALREFLQRLVCRLFRQYDALCFECDDCDWAAICLKSLFRDRNASCVDTCVFDCGAGSSL